ncbi:unnamed protein product [Echinostoma caproni]|uniref:ABC transporter domain-containing protein n=1 Tax=Echinostoma caproni TaxID=27848 RepID=A0A183A1C5_9TREM|nr:unnamed protein product [Echinostoma caproni]
MYNFHYLSIASNTCDKVTRFDPLVECLDHLTHNPRQVSETANEEEVKRCARYDYPAMVKKLGNFALTVEAGSFTDSEIVVMLGENGTGKTTLIRMLAGNLKPDDDVKLPVMHISYKPQKISPKSEKTVQHLLLEKIRDSFTHPQFSTDVLKPLQMERLYDQQVSAKSSFR